VKRTISKPEPKGRVRGYQERYRRITIPAPLPLSFGFWPRPLLSDPSAISRTHHTHGRFFLSCPSAFFNVQLHRPRSPTAVLVRPSTLGRPRSFDPIASATDWYGRSCRSHSCSCPDQIRGLYCCARRRTTTFTRSPCRYSPLRCRCHELALQVLRLRFQTKERRKHPDCFEYFGRSLSQRLHLHRWNPPSAAEYLSDQPTSHESKSTCCARSSSQLLVQYRPRPPTVSYATHPEPDGSSPRTHRHKNRCICRRGSSIRPSSTARVWWRLWPSAARPTAWDPAHGPAISPRRSSGGSGGRRKEQGSVDCWH
jgi:hypothetical protein